MEGTGGAVAGQRIVAAGIRHRARLSDPPGWLLDTPVDQGAGRARAVASTGGASGVGGGRDQPAQRARLDVEFARRCAGQLAGRTDVCPMMQLSAEAIWLATTAVDMRTGIDGLSLHVQQALGHPPCDGTAYVFANRRRTRLKVVCWDGTGVWMCLRRLHHGQFVWPQADEACLRIPPKLDTCSAANWTVVPSQTGHPFQAKLDTLDATARG